MDNNRIIVKLGKPIVNIESKNFNPESRRIKPDTFYVLKNSLFLETVTKVVLEIDIFPNKGCYNGSNGLVKEIFNEEVSSPPPKLLTFFWVEIEDHAGPSFFPPKNEERKKWVPIYPSHR